MKYTAIAKAPWSLSLKESKKMSNEITYRASKLALIFTKEQLKEPTAFFWTLLSPSAVFYLLNYSRGQIPPYNLSYIESTSWFYAYISSNVAFFGLSFYIIGRRESGFTRSFIYKPEGKLIFLLAKFISYSLISILYCSVFYCLTRLAFGSPNTNEVFLIMASFYFCFLLFSIPALLLTLLPTGFQTANTLFSIISFAMLISGIYGISAQLQSDSFIQLLNPLWIASEIMSKGLWQRPQTAVLILSFFTCAFFITLRHLRINPIWSRY
jgi:ABC-2 type transport system permease protein